MIIVLKINVELCIVHLDVNSVVFIVAGFAFNSIPVREARFHVE